jgi:hypothetical protein
MMSVHKLSWALWIGGTILIAASWIDVVTPQIGWVGFGIAVVGTMLSRVNSQPRIEEPKQAPAVFLCDSCLLNDRETCRLPQRPRAVHCPDYMNA